MLQSPEAKAKMIEKVVMGGDLAALTPVQRYDFVTHVCKALGLRIETRPFEYLTLNGKLVLYARKDCTDQLRYNHNISTRITHRELNLDQGVYTVEVEASTPEGRKDVATGSVGIMSWQKADKDLGEKEGKWVTAKGDGMANNIMKAETKAKRRATLSICGLGFLDEAELDTMKGQVKPAEAKKASPQQVEKLLALIHSDQWAAVRKHYQVDSFQDLSEDDAARIIQDRELAVQVAPTL